MWDPAVNPPGGVSYAPPILNFDALSKIPDDFFAGAQTGRQYQVQNAFRGGIPTDQNGNPDFMAAANRLYQLGDFGDANSLAQTGIARQGMNIANDTNQQLGVNAKPANAAQASQTAATPAGNYYSVIAQRESSNNPTIVNPTTKAAGLYQFEPATWSSVRQAHPDLNLPASVAQASPEQQTAAAQAFTADNAKQLQAENIPVTDRTLNMAHFLGAGGAVKFFNAAKQNPSVPADYIFPAEAKANPKLFYQLDQNGNPDTTKPIALGTLYANMSRGFGPGLTALPGGKPLDIWPGNQPQAATGQTPAALKSAGVQADQNEASAATAPAPAPVPAPAVQQASASAPAPGQPNDPTLGGLVPQSWINQGKNAGQFVTWLRARAAIPGVPKASADAWNKQADGIEQTLRMANTPQPLLKEYELWRSQGGTGTIEDYQVEKQARIAQAEQNAKAGAAATTAEAEATGKALGELPNTLAKNADAAKLQNNVLDEMVQASPTWQHGWGASAQEAAREAMQGVGKFLNLDMSMLDKPIADYQTFMKNAGTLQRNALAEASNSGSRGGIQLANLFAKSLPSGEMSEKGFATIASQFKGLNDFHIAKQQAGQAWSDAHGSMKGFETDWNRNVSPSAFVIRRLQLEDPDGLKDTLNQMGKTPAGKAAINDLRAQMTWANQNGLFGQ